MFFYFHNCVNLEFIIFRFSKGEFMDFYVKYTLMLVFGMAASFWIGWSSPIKQQVIVQPVQIRVIGSGVEVEVQKPQPKEKNTHRRQEHFAIPKSDGRVIVLDAGHGGKDSGAICNGIQEKDLNLKVALQMEKILQANGYSVVMTRREDKYLTLEERVAVAHASQADLFVSVHANAARNQSAHGVEVFHHHSASHQSVNLARHVSSRLGDLARNRGVKSADFYVLRKTKMPAILVEVGFLTNEYEALRLCTSSYVQQIADSIADGICAAQYRQRSEQNERFAGMMTLANFPR